MLDARKKISRCITNKSSPASNTGRPCSALKKSGQKGCHIHRSVEVNASAAMERASLPRHGADGKRECTEQGKAGAPPLPRAPGFYQASALPLLPAGQLSSRRRQHQSWATPRCKQRKHAAVGTEPSRVFGTRMSFATHLASQHRII